MRKFLAVGAITLLGMFAARDILTGGKESSKGAWLEPSTDFIDGNLVELGTLGAADDGKVIKWNNPAGKLVIGDAGGVPAGVIVMWSGTLASIPSGWSLCDGTGVTPDLRDRFICGASAGVDPGGTDGSNTYTLTEDQLPSHTHPVDPPSTSTNTTGAHTHTRNFMHPYQALTGSESQLSFPLSGNGTAKTSSAGAHSHSVNIPSFTSGSTGSGSSIDNRPAYYKLAYIMKL